MIMDCAFLSAVSVTLDFQSMPSFKMMSLGLKNLQQNLQPFALALTSKGLTPEPLS